MILLMGMAVGIDYSLFYVKRVRAERQRGRGRLDAIEIAAQTAGHSVIVSGVAVIVSMLGLFVSGSPVFASLATGSIIVVAVAVLGSLTVLPAVLVKLGRRIDRPRVPVLWRLSASTREPRMWPALLRPAMTHPGRTLTISVLALAVLALPTLELKMQSSSAASLARSIPATHSLDRLSAAFPSQQSTDVIVVRHRDRRGARGEGPADRPGRPPGPQPAVRGRHRDAAGAGLGRRDGAHPRGARALRHGVSGREAGRARAARRAGGQLARRDVERGEVGRRGRPGDQYGRRPCPVVGHALGSSASSSC